MDMKAIALQMVAAAVFAGVASGQAAVVQAGSAVQSAKGVAPVPPVRSSPICDPNLRSLIYIDCALWFDGGKVRRGLKGDVIAKEGIAGPIKLTWIVKGDSAQRYARAYEQLIWVGAPMRTLSILSGGAAWYLSRSRCKTAGCSNASTQRAARIWAYSSASLLVISVPFTGAAHRDAARAIWWHNATLKTLATP
jgi:hypothetical protein